MSGPATPERDAPPLERQRCGYVAVIGAPNAGKSTLVNALVGTKVTIVSRKVQTTRTTVRGIFIRDAAQVVLVDTPGIFAPKRRLDRAMVRSAWTHAADADIVMLLVDAQRGFDEAVGALAAQVAGLPHPKLLVLNKIDAIARAGLLALAADGNGRAAFAATFMISALAEDGLDALARDLAQRMPAGPWLFDADQVSDLPMRVLAAEVTREVLYDRLHDELPYASTVETDSWQRRADGSVRIEQTIYVERDSQKKIVLGKGGETIKAISMRARRSIAEIADAPVHLFLFVKVRDDWGNDPERYREIGLEFPKDEN